MKRILTAFLLLLSVCCAQAQTRVFKEIDKDIVTQMKEIRQDDALVGYLVFTQLEKASSDSFSYKITIMDENMDDIGVVRFKEQKLFLQSVSFGDDVLCLGFLKSNFTGMDYKPKNWKPYLEAAKSSVFLQFLNLDGKIIKSTTIPADVKHAITWPDGTNPRGGGNLKNQIQIKNIPNFGFSCFYGDEKKNNLLTLNTTGDIVWQKQVKEQDVQSFGLLTSERNIYLILKKKEKYEEGGYELLGYGASDSSVYPKYVLKDKQGNSLKVLACENDPVTGKLYLAGNIIDPKKGNHYYNGKEMARGPYCGVFTVNINGSKKGDIKETYSYWGDGSQSFITKKSRLPEKKSFLRITRAFKDYQGNTIFAGSTFTRKAKYGSIFFTLVTLPSFFPPYIIAGHGFTKVKIRETALLKQNEKGSISVDNFVETNTSTNFPGSFPISSGDSKRFYFVSNADTKTKYIVIDDIEDIFIYNVNQKKIVRTIPHKEGNVLTNVYTGKEGHIMVTKYNLKDRSTTFSLEAL